MEGNSIPKYLEFQRYFQILNALERLGYRVVTSSSIVTGFGKHDTKWVFTIVTCIPEILDKYEKKGTEGPPVKALDL